MISFAEFLLEAPAAIVGTDAEDLRSQMTSFLIDINDPSTKAFNIIRDKAVDIGHGFFMKKKGSGLNTTIELYRSIGNRIDIMSYISSSKLEGLGKSMVIESVAKLNDNVLFPNDTFLDKLTYIGRTLDYNSIVSDKFHTQGANHLWIKIMSIARNNGRDIGAYNLSTKKVIPINNQSVAIAIRKAGYITNPKVVLYIK